MKCSLSSSCSPVLRVSLIISLRSVDDLEAKLFNHTSTSERLTALLGDHSRLQIHAAELHQQLQSTQLQLQQLKDLADGLSNIHLQIEEYQQTQNKREGGRERERKRKRGSERN